jgi:phospholipid transport system transporter-binding protein
MKTVVDITKTEGKWLVSGNLLLDDVENLLTQNAVINESSALEIDLSGVAEVDSVAISLLFEWARQARAKNCALVYSNLPMNLTSLASLYGVLDFLPVATKASTSH